MESASQYWNPIVREELEKFIHQENYPCIAARLAWKRDEIRSKIYHTLGLGSQAAELGKDLLDFIGEQEKTQSPYLSFVAVFEHSFFDTEEEFEKAMWAELSAVARSSGRVDPWDPKFSSNPVDQNFCFSFGGQAFFIVGLHPHSSRKARRFFKPAMVFNLYRQFEMLDEETEFYPMVKINRKRDLAFQGTVNPMVEQYSEKREAIQFSGKNNPEDWVCPFQP